MFDLVNKHRKFVQILLAMITLPFAFWGIDSYFRDAASTDEVARIGSSKITLQQLDNAMRERADLIRSRQGGAVDARLFESPEFRASVLNELVEQRLLLLESERLGVAANDVILRELIAQIPAFQENGKFSPAKYEQVLRAQGMTPSAFEQNLRRDLTQQMLVNGVAATTQISNTQLNLIIDAEKQEREVAVAVIEASNFLKSASVDEAAVRQYYEANPRQFQVPERVKVSYVVLNDPKVVAKESENFSNMVYEQSDTFKDVAKALNLKIEESGWISSNGQGAQGVLANPKVLQAIFNPGSLKDRRNSAAIEVAPNVLISVRVTAHEPVSLRPFESVAADIRQFLTRKAALEKATVEGEARLADLRAGKAVDIKWSPTKTVSRLQPGGLSRDAMQLVTGVDTAQLPAFSGGVVSGEGYSLFKVSAIKPGSPLSDDKRAQIATAYQRFVQQADVVSLMVALRDRYPVKIAKRPEGEKQP
ncbi:MAG: SurA N-terminal domain-containing protein [Fluviibacter sp.]